MIYFILRLIFFYILFLFVKSLIKSFIRGKISDAAFKKGGSFESQDAFRQAGQKKDQQQKDVIEAEFRKL